MYSFKVPEDKMISVLIDTDAKNEADDQYAITHALLSPKLRVLGLQACHFSDRRSKTSMMDSYEECVRICDLLKSDVPVLKGNKHDLEKDPEETSEATDFLIDAIDSHEEKIVVLCTGALTNIAAAILKEPKIAKKMRLIWVGGTLDPNAGYCFEANARNDYKAVNVVMENVSDLTLIPKETYVLMQTSLAELQCKVKPAGKIGAYLFDQLNTFNYDINRPWTSGESWCLGDNTAVGVALNENCARTRLMPRYLLDRDLKMSPFQETVKVVYDLNVRYIFEDFFCKLCLCR